MYCSPPSLLSYGHQLIEDDDVAAVAAALRGEYLTCGPLVEAFERQLAEVVGARYAVACSSGTAALHLAAMALGLSAKDRVLVPSMTFAATASAARIAGAEVVFLDVDPGTGLLDLGSLERILEGEDGKKASAIIPVHLNGQCVDMEPLLRLARRHDLKVIEDATHALGGSYLTQDGNEVRVGACRHSDMAVFSFHPVKTIAMGEGGALTTNDEGLYRRLLLLRSHGIVRDASSFVNEDLAHDADGEANPWYYEVQEIGLNYRASDIHCALGLSQLKKLDRFVARRRQLAERYDALLGALAPAIRPLAKSAHCRPAWHLYVILVNFESLGISRAKFMQRLRQQNVGTQVHYLPVHLHPYYRNRYGAVRCPGAEAYYRQALSLPLHPGMDNGDVDRVVEAIRCAVN